MTFSGSFAVSHTKSRPVELGAFESTTIVSVMTDHSRSYIVVRYTGSGMQKDGHKI